jgi:hypothetical protein
LAPRGRTPGVAAPQRPGRIFLAGEMTGCCGAAQASPGGWVGNPVFRYVLGVAELILPAAALVGDQAPPRWPRVRIPSLAFAGIVWAVEIFATARASTPTPSGPATGQGNATRATDARVCQQACQPPDRSRPICSEPSRMTGQAVTLVSGLS